MKTFLLSGILTAALLAVLIVPASADSRAVREGRSPSNYVPTPSTKSGGTGKGYTGGYTGFTPLLIPDSMPEPDVYPRFESASPYPPCAFCNGGFDPSDNPAADLPRYEEMNPNTDPIPPSWYAVPMD
jgi:hypothetical protein